MITKSLIVNNKSVAADVLIICLGFAEAAMHTALCLKNYEDILNTEEIYSLLSLASSACQAFGTCSRAFMKLENLESVSTNIVNRNFFNFNT